MLGDNMIKTHLIRKEVMEAVFCRNGIYKMNKRSS